MTDKGGLTNLWVWCIIWHYLGPCRRALRQNFGVEMRDSKRLRSTGRARGRERERHTHTHTHRKWKRQRDKEIESNWTVKKGRTWCSVLCYMSSDADKKSTSPICVTGRRANGLVIFFTEKLRIPEIIMRCWNIWLTVDTCTGLSGKGERGGGERRLDILLVSGLLLFSLDSGRDACILLQRSKNYELQ